MANPCSCWDFRIGTNKITIENLKEWLDKYCDKWVFQEELSESKYEHYQGRIHLKVKERASTLLKKIPKGGDFKPTSNKNTKNDFYVMKEDTRVRGPWSNTDQPTPYDIQILIDEGLYKWQQQVIDLATEKKNIRIINIIVDRKGGKGKSSLRRYLEWNNLAEGLPLVNDFIEMVQMAYSLPSTCYIIDMPRSLKKDKLAGIFGGIEYIKGGDYFDKRYTMRKRKSDPPNVIVFTNEYPNANYLSIDRWKIWRISSKGTLKEVPTSELPDGEAL